MIEKEGQLREEYRRIQAALGQWGGEVDSFLKEKLIEDWEDKGFVKIPPSYRIKDEDSFIEKALYRKSYENPIVDISDKVGTRAVFLTSLDVYAATEIVENHGTWLVSVDKRFEDDRIRAPDNFRYQSTHIVVTADQTTADRIGVSKEVLTCEIQLRTLLQHAYAEMSHPIAYKGPFSDDKEILRQLAKSMALMETTDDVFVKVINDMENEERASRIFKDRLIDLYIEVVPDFDETTINRHLEESIFELKKENR